MSRDTIQRVLRELSSEAWIESRQGSGSRVLKNQRIQSSTAEATRMRQPALGPLLGEAFEQPEVALDIYTLTSESLDAHIRLQAERIHYGSIAPQRIALRVILPSKDLDLPYPRNPNNKDDPRLRERLDDITARHTDSLREVTAGSHGSTRCGRISPKSRDACANMPQSCEQPLPSVRTSRRQARCERPDAEEWQTTRCAYFTVPPVVCSINGV
ncbi:hypothetical protein [Streptomyces sp. NPDC018693]|uniref:hypothetical protein n=1 Tax=unclassified Streptomyces TaxID=2593676 RepID=UPI0037B53ADD